MEQVQLLFDAGRWQQAGELLLQNLQLYPQEAELYAAHGLLQINHFKDAKGAEEAARSALRYDETNYRAYIVLNGTLASQTRYDEALAVCDTFQELYPHDSQPYLCRAWTELGQMQYGSLSRARRKEVIDAAAEHIAQARGIDPTDVRLLELSAQIEQVIGLQWSEQDKDRKKRAQEFIDQGLALDPQNSSLKILDAQQPSKSKQSAQMLAGVLGSDPQNADAQAQLNLMLVLRLGRIIMSSFWVLIFCYVHVAVPRGTAI
ncbi:MAG: hypothetical protein LKG01_00805 [Bifidobacterium subtile]|jgi:tetratricopeptide (TPR) repeat protein|nr:hypothetical protein [Bifidobacterium subtile]